MADECARERQLRQPVVAVKSLEKRAMAQVDYFQDHELVRHIWNEFLDWGPAVDAEYFPRKLRHLHEEWVLNRYPSMTEPKEKWRFLVATLSTNSRTFGSTSRGSLREPPEADVVLEPAVPERKQKTPEQLEAQEQKKAKLRMDLEALERKVSYFRKAQENEQGETNLRVFQGLLPGEE